MIPKSYTTGPDKDWQPWNNGTVSSHDLRRHDPEQDYLYINGVLVFAFFFELEAGNIKWNCKIGFERRGLL